MNEESGKCSVPKRLSLFLHLTPSMELAEMNYRQVQDYLKTSDSAIIPVGAIEQHGPSCAVGTDACLAETFSRDLAEQLGILRTPTMNFGVSQQQMVFPGTISLKPETLASVFRDIHASLQHHGFRKFFVINGHYENSATIKLEIGELLQHFHHSLYYLIDFWELEPVQKVMQKRVQERGGHAGATELALMMHIAPDQVDSSALVEEWPSINAFVSNNIQHKHITKMGVIGSDQKKATPEIGAELYNTIIETYKAHISKRRCSQRRGDRC